MAYSTLLGRMSPSLAEDPGPAHCFAPAMPGPIAAFGIISKSLTQKLLALGVRA